MFFAFFNRAVTALVIQFAYLPVMMAATKEGVAILFLKTSAGRGALTIVPSLFFAAYKCTHMSLK